MHGLRVERNREEEMGGSAAAPLPCHHRMVIGEITRSHQLVARLKSLVLPSPPASERWPELAGNLFEEVMQSYKVSVSMLLHPCSCGQPQPAEEMISSEGSCWGVVEEAKNNKDQPERMEISYAPHARKEQQTRTSTTTTPHLDSHRWRKSGKKKTSTGDIQRVEQQSWTTITPTPHFDGHQWRKYGEKNISNSEFSRNYYRCSHFKEEGCQATKTVQQKEGSDDPVKFLVTYKMQHTCKSTNLPIYPSVMESAIQRASVISFAPGSTPQRNQRERSSYVPMLIDLNLNIQSQ